MSRKNELLQEAMMAFGVSESKEDKAQAFIENNSWLLNTEIDYSLYTGYSRQAIYTQITLPNLKRPDFIRREWAPSAGWLWQFIEIEPSGVSPLNKDCTYSAQLNKALSQIFEWQQYAKNNVTAMRELFFGFSPPLFGLIIIGRSDLMNPNQRAQWQTIRRAHQDIKIRTYTWLIEKLANLHDDIIALAVKNGSARGRDNLIREREIVQPPVSPNPFVKIRIQEIYDFTKKLQALAEVGEFPRAKATAFENLVKNVMPIAGSIAQKIREIIHDLDTKEPNVTVKDLKDAFDEFYNHLEKRDS